MQKYAPLKPVFSEFVRCLVKKNDSLCCCLNTAGFAKWRDLARKDWTREFTSLSETSQWQIRGSLRFGCHVSCSCFSLFFTFILFLWCTSTFKPAIFIFQERQGMGWFSECCQSDDDEAQKCPNVYWPYKRRNSRVHWQVSPRNL